MSLGVEAVRGALVQPYLAELARLRIAVFREWPYLYSGNEAYEAAYLEAYALSAGSVFVLARDGERIVGASSGLPLADDAAAFQQPLQRAGFDVDRVFYFGESVLLPDYRGRGLGHAFFDAREAHARALGGFEWTSFCSVQRSASDVRRPPHHRGNEHLWTRRGYTERKDLQCQIDWPEEQGGPDVPHALTYWMRDCRVKDEHSREQAGSGHEP